MCNKDIIIQAIKGVKGWGVRGKAGKIDELRRLIRDSAQCRIALSGDKLSYESLETHKLHDGIGGLFFIS
jgi:hypothetical protein